jgi:two-component system, OmpR family, alkaline phosphatase synthesis response regulator PhoP
MSKVLIIDDEVHIAEGIKLNLELNGHEVHIKENGFLGVNEWKAWRPDIIVLDLMMPIMDGYMTLEKIREEDKKIPILVLSAKDAVKDKVRCLSRGVDDYLSKPFNLEEFLLRIDRLLLRASWGQDGNLESKDTPDEVCFGKNKVSFKLKKGFRDDLEISLTLQELNLLEVFVQNIGLPLSRSELLEQGWGYSQDTSTRTVDNFIVRFRKYFEDDPKKPEFFKSVRSIGYVFSIEE